MFHIILSAAHLINVLNIQVGQEIWACKFHFLIGFACLTRSFFAAIIRQVTLVYKDDMKCNKSYGKDVINMYHMVPTLTLPIHVFPIVVGYFHSTLLNSRGHL